MNLNSKKIYLFIKVLIKKFKTNIVITQGYKNVDVLDKFKFQYFKNLKSNKIKFKDKSIILIEDASFRDLENISFKFEVIKFDIPSADLRTIFPV